MEINHKNGLFIPDYLEKYLHEKLSILKPKYSLEFGTGTGTATEIIAKYSECVDTFETYKEWSDFSKNKLEKYDNINFNIGYFHHEMPLEMNRYNFAFIDGPKGAPGIERISPFLYQWKNIKSGALCIFDDANQKGVRTLLKILHDIFKINYIISGVGRGIGEFVKP